MKFFLKNRARAGAVLAAVILFSIVFGVWRSVAVQAGRVEREFTKEDEFGESVSSTLEDLAYHTEAFVSACQTVLGEDEDSAALRSAAQTLTEKADDPIALEGAYTAVQRSAQALQSRLLVSGEYKDEARWAHMALESDLSILRQYDDYNAAASRYNEVTAHFPASLFAKDTAVVFD